MEIDDWERERDGEWEWEEKHKKTEREKREVSYIVVLYNGLDWMTYEYCMKIAFVIILVSIYWQNLHTAI